MNFKQFIIIMSVGTVVSWLLFWGILLSFYPSQIGQLGFIVVYSSGFLALFGTMALISIAWRGWRTTWPRYRLVIVSLRQSFLLALFVLLASYFQVVRSLTWWNGIILLAAIIMLEFFFISADNYHLGRGEKGQ